MKNLLIFVALTPFTAPLLQAAEITFFASGVDPNDPSTYYNVQQGNTPTCWAASGGNVIAHWQKYNAPNAPAIAQSPEGAYAPQGDDVYWTYRSLYNGYSGGWASTLYRYWLGHHSGLGLNGYYPISDADGVLLVNKPSGCGGFYESYYKTMEEVQKVAWAWLDVGDILSEKNYTLELSRAIYYSLSAGHALVIDVKNHSHAITLWGASFDTETQLMTTAWVTDSSGALFSKKGMSKILINDAGEKLTMNGEHYAGISIVGRWVAEQTIDNAHFLGLNSDDVMAFVRSGVPIPEPSAFALPAGMAVLGLALLRRRKRAGLNSAGVA